MSTRCCLFIQLVKCSISRGDVHLNKLKTCFIIFVSFCPLLSRFDWLTTLQFTKAMEKKETKPKQLLVGKSETKWQDFSLKIQTGKNSWMDVDTVYQSMYMYWSFCGNFCISACHTHSWKKEVDWRNPREKCSQGTKNKAIANYRGLIF